MNSLKASWLAAVIVAACFSSGAQAGVLRVVNADSSPVRIDVEVGNAAIGADTLPTGAERVYDLGGDTVSVDVIAEIIGQPVTPGGAGSGTATTSVSIAANDDVRAVAYEDRGLRLDIGIRGREVRSRSLEIVLFGLGFISATLVWRAFR